MRLFSKALTVKVFFSSLTTFTFLSFQLNAQNCLSNNYAANQPMTASEGSDLAANLVDGNLSTDWFSGSDGGKWIYVDLGQSRSLCKVTLKWGLWGHIPQTVVQGSNTANNDWVDLYSIPAADNGIHSADNTYDYFDVDLSSTTTSYRYVRLYYPSGASWGPHLKELEVYIKNPPTLPSVSITAPQNGTEYTQGANINFTANASEQGGSISKVEYYQGNTLIGQSTNASINYLYTWQNVQQNDYVIVAKAYDANNHVATSSPINVYVNVPSSAWALSGNTGNAAIAFFGTTDNQPVIFKTNNLERFRITPDGKIGINTTVVPTGASLAVNGELWARKLKITQSTWADYVFNKNYKLLSLPGLESYIKEHHHLPGMPSAGKVKKEGIDVGNNQEVLLKKIEELSLYMIELNKNMIELNKKVEKLSKENKELKKRLNHSK